MRKPLLSAILILLLALPSALPAKDKAYQAPRAYNAKTYPAHETHDDEKVSIAADPYDMPDKSATVFTVDYMSAGLLPIYMIVTNDGDQPISLNKLHVTLITRKRVKITPSEPDDMYRRLDRATFRADGPSLPFPIPKKKNKGVSQQTRDEVVGAQFLAKAVEPHATQAGFMFFDVQGIENPPAGGKLEITGLMDSKGNELFFFELPMEKYLNYQPIKQP